MAKVVPIHVTAGMRELNLSSGAKNQLTKARRVTDMKAVWEEFKASGQFFRSVQMAEDGGFGEVATLFTVDRFIWGIVAIAAVVLNVYYIISNVVTSLKWPWTVRGDAQADENEARNLILKTIARRLTGGTHDVQDEVLIALMEGTVLLILTFQLLQALVFTVKKEPCVRWYGISEIFWEILPDVGSMSAMKLLYFVAPQIFGPEVTNEFFQDMELWEDGRKCRAVWQMSYYLATRVLCLFIGFEVFMMKFSIASVNLRQATTRFSAIIVAAGFLNQMLGVVDVRRFSKRRLFIFIFGGEDGVFTEREEAVAKTWCSMLAMHVWEQAHAENRRKSMGVFWFLAVALSYVDSDFQKLTLNDSAKELYQSQRRDLPPELLEDAPTEKHMTPRFLKPRGKRMKRTKPEVAPSEKAAASDEKVFSPRNPGGEGQSEEAAAASPQPSPRGEVQTEEAAPPAQEL